MYHQSIKVLSNIQVSKNSTVRKNDYNVGSNSGKPDDGNEFNSDARHERAGSGEKYVPVTWMDVILIWLLLITKHGYTRTKLELEH